MSRRELPERAARSAVSASPKSTRTRNQPRRESARVPGRFSYTENTDESDFSDGDNRRDSDPRGSDLSGPPSPIRPVANIRTRSAGNSREPVPPLRKTRSRANVERLMESETVDFSRHAPKRRKVVVLGRPRRANQTEATNPMAAPDAACPPWPRGLPYLILLTIFQYASYPLWNDEFVPKPSKSWLLQVALLRRDFVEPALAALYYSPPLFPPDRAQQMIEMLRSQPASSMVDYRRQIRYFDIDAPSTLIRKYGGREPLQIKDLIEVAPQLRGITVNFPEDNPQYKAESVSRIDNSKSSAIYSGSVFDALDSSGCPFRHWKWNYFLKPTQDMPWKQLPLIHSRPSFQKLRSLEICRFGGAGASTAGWASNMEPLATALGMLPALESLKISQCDLTDWEDIFASMGFLEEVAFIDCRNLDSEFLTNFLDDHGRELKALTLNYNECLDLAFTSGLGDSCPRLESLDMDLTFFSNLLVSSAPGPRFPVLLPESHVPKWPTTLRRISLVQLRKWDAESAEAFFQSLADAAPTLLSLRELIIKASLEIEWRDRIKFRNKWETAMCRIFLQESAPPMRHYVSPAEHRVSLKGRSEAEEEASKTTREARAKLRQRKSSEDESSGTDEDEETQTMAVGTCRVVDVRIDNLRPMEYRYNESNFIDDEPSGDEDWDGG